MFPISLIVIFVIFFVNKNSAFSFDSCENVNKNFEKGQEIFNTIHNLGENLIKNGYVVETNDPFTSLSFLSPSNESTSLNYLTANRALAGCRYLLDYYGKNESNMGMEETVEFLKNITTCVPSKERCINRPMIKCDTTYRYRSYDGVCNSLTSPYQASTSTAYARLTDAFYDDNIQEPRKSVSGNDLPGVRFVVNDVLTPKHMTFLCTNTKPNLAFYFFGQFFTHDIVHAQSIHPRNASRNGVRCCTSDYRTFLPKSEMHYGCLPIQIPSDDKGFDTNARCHNYIRTQRISPNNCELGSAQQVSRPSGYIDLSLVYGVSEDESKLLRTFSKGLLKSNTKGILQVRDNCTGGCYITGDRRANQTPQLTLFHALFQRLHNLIATWLLELNPNWDDEKVFQESRHINIAIMQHVTYTEYIPILLGIVKPFSCIYKRCDYRSSADASVINDFSTGMFRFMHIFCPEQLKLYDEDGNVEHSRNLSNFIEDSMLLETKYESIVRGLLYQEINLYGFGDQIRNHVFSGLDLISMDLQRGRDHGLAPYWKYRELCGLSPVNNFVDLYPIMSERNIKLLKKIYESVKDIDLLVGAALEDKYGQLIGPTHRCLATIQFLNLKQGDRFFYTHSNSPHPFTFKQLNTIKNITIANLFCLTSNITAVQMDAFNIPRRRMTECTNMKKLNLDAWKE